MYINERSIMLVASVGRRLEIQFVHFYSSANRSSTVSQCRRPMQSPFPKPAKAARLLSNFRVPVPVAVAVQVPV